MTQSLTTGGYVLITTPEALDESVHRERFAMLGGKSRVASMLAHSGVPIATGGGGVKGKIVSVDELSAYRDPRIRNRRAKGNR